MSRATGNRLPPGALNPASFQLQLSGQYTLTATPTDLSLTNATPGYAPTATSYTVPEGGMVGMAMWTADFTLITAGAVTAATVDIVIDGAIPASAPQAIWDPGNITDGRLTVPGSWPFALTAGVHSFGLRASIVATTGVVRLAARHTNVSIWLHP